MFGIPVEHTGKEILLIFNGAAQILPKMYFTMLRYMYKTYFSYPQSPVMM